MKTLLLGFLVLTACKSNAKTTDDGGIYGGPGIPRLPLGRGPTKADPPPAGHKDCSLDNGTAKIETNAQLDTSCVTMLGAFDSFKIGAEGGPQLAVLGNVKGGVEVGVTYPLTGNEVVGAFFNKKRADKLAQTKILTATYTPFELPKDKGDLGLGSGTVTFRKLPPKGQATPFAADFDITFESYRMDSVKYQVVRVKTGVSLHFRGSVDAN